MIKTTVESVPTIKVHVHNNKSTKACTFDLGEAFNLNDSIPDGSLLSYDANANSWVPTSPNFYSIEASNVTSQVEVDFVLVREVQSICWFVTAADEVNQRTEALHVTAIHNGNVTEDADSVNYLKFNELSAGGEITNFDVQVALIGTGLTQKMQLLVESTDSIDVRVTRMLTFNSK